ncbi:HlyD family secretion protein [Gammaproteobacteria bacterium]
MRKILLLLVVIGGCGALVLQFVPHTERRLTAAGTIEARTIRIGSKVGGRIAEVHTQEGSRVRTGELLVVFEATSLAAELDQARAQRAEAAAQLARLEHGARPEEVAEARATANQTKGMRNAEVAQARAELERAQTDLGNAERSARRAAALRAKDLVSRQSFDDLEAHWHAQQAVVRAAQQAVMAAEAHLSAGRAVTLRTEHGFRVEDIDAGRAALARAEAAVREVEARYAEREVRAPADAIVEVFDRRPGDLVAAGTVLARLLEDRQLYVMVYVPETQVGQVLIGQAVKVRVDAFPNVVHPGRVEQIREEAEFLPRNVQTPEERVHQVIGVKVGFGESDPHLHPGMTAEVEFSGTLQP